MKNRIDVLNKLRHVAGELQRIQKEVSSFNVPGLELTREDLGIRKPKKRKLIHGQRHYQPRNSNQVTTPSSGQGDFPFGMQQ